MKKRNDWRKAGALALAAAVLGNSMIFPDGGLQTAYASEAVSKTPIGSYTEAELNCFQDNVLEYWEIQGLVEHYNPTYLKQLEVYNGNPDGESGLSKDQLLVMADLFRYEAKELEAEADERKDELSEKEYQEYQDNIKTLKRYAREKEKAAEGTAETKHALRIVRNQETIAVSAMMREYQNLCSQDAIAQKNLELAQLSYASSERQCALGMISAEELLAASDSLHAAEASRDASAASLTQSRQSLITALGWGYGDLPEIRTIPEPDVAKAEGYDLAADTELAVGANNDVYDLRKKDKSEFNGTKDKLRQIAEKEDQVRMQMEFLYKDVQQKLLSYQSAEETFPASEAKFAQAGRKLELGMISRAEYLSEEITWMTAKANKEQAALDLLEAMETYEWAIQGEMSL